MQMIYTDKPRPIKEALAQMTDTWILDANYSVQTVMDMRDFIAYLIEFFEWQPLLIETMKCKHGKPYSECWDRECCSRP